MFFQKKKKNSRQTYPLHLMNSLLNVFCYIISNVSIRKNLHRVQLMTESYPDRQNYSEKQCLLHIQGAWHALPNQSGEIKSRSQESFKCQTIRGVYPKGVPNYFPINLGQSSQDSENLSGASNSQGHAFTSV